jgi:hypothetical protein
MMVGKSDTGRQQGRRRATDAQIVALVDARRQHSLRYNHRFFTRLPSWYNTYRMVWQGRLSQFRNNVQLPFIFSMIQSDVARKVQTSLGGWPIVSFQGYAPEDVQRARKNEILISAQMKDCDSLIKGVDFFLQADLYGVAVARYGWKHVVRKNKVRMREQVAPGMNILVEREYNAEHFNGPDWEVIDPLDFWPQPGRKRIEDMSWVIHRYWTELDDMKEDIYQAEQSGDEPYFDKAAVNLLEAQPLGPASQDEFKVRQLIFRNQWDYEARQVERYAKPIEVWEMHGTVPDEMAPDGIRTRCIAIGNGRVVLKNREEPFWDEQKPFKSYSPMPDPHTFFAPGKVEIGEKMQAAANRIANQKLDALDLLIDPQYVVSTSANLNTQNLFSRSGKLILVDGPADDSSIRPLTHNMAGLQAAYQEIGQLWQFMQLGSGINDIVMGTQQSDRETARGFLGRQENTMTRLMLEARIAEEGFIEPLANSFRNLDRQFLTLPYEQKILGSVSTVNPITGLPYPQQTETIDWDDMAPDYRARAVGASQMVGKSARQQNFVSLLQMMSANPALMQMVNWANFARQMFDLFDFKNVEELLVTQVPAVNQAADQSGMDPMTVASQVSQPLSQLNPDILGQLMNTQPGGAQMPMLGANGQSPMLRMGVVS